MKNTRKILLAVSGGADSMWMLYKYKNEDIVVAHVNYNKRSTSLVDETIVVDFCQKYNIKYFVKQVFPHEVIGNFQNWARQVRYDFFKQIYQQENCDILYTAHHKDDFLETALIQSRSKRKPLKYGIASRIFIDQMEIYRPFIYRFYKSTILKKVLKNKITYAEDISNFDPIYTRNKIRLEMENKLVIYKNFLLLYYIYKNWINTFKSKKILSEYKIWWKTDFDVDEFKNFKYQEEVIFHLLNTEFDNIKVSSAKIASIISYIKSSNSNKYFKLSKNCSIQKKHKKLLIFKRINLDNITKK